ncbi:unnamed protein product [Moneuplotes crassus]|uniref:protein-tyrosine-phosphatase n=1 Tax=Euplotes crassus TaxID=5936 RepID=A0AAD1XWP4_EUPCR|nr:unnamed protein product [Moneuplotes crassus]
MSEILDFLYVSSYKMARNHKFIKEKNIKYIISCGKFDDPWKKEGVKYKKINLLDNLSENISSHFIYCYEFIEKARRQKARVLVHCLKGMSRSTTIVISYVMAHLKMPYEDALKYVQSKHKMTCPNENFRKQLKAYDWSEYLQDDQEETKEEIYQEDVFTKKKILKL